MKSPAKETAVQGSSDVFGLLEKRATIEQWIARLDSQRGSVSEKIIERVRADYERRLADTLEALGSHRSAVEDQLLSASDRLSIAETQRAEAEERLEEGRLRNVIGELGDEEWSVERVSLEQAVESAAGEEDELRAEVGRLTELMSQLNQEETAQAEVPGTEPALDPDATLAEGVADPAGVVDPAASADVPGIFTAAAALFDEAAEQAEFARQEPYVPQGAAGAEPEPFALDEDPFLAGIDRVLADGADTGELPIRLSGDDEPLEDTAPKPGLKCGECGYTNDLSAWFCGVCGADVG